MEPDAGDYCQRHNLRAFLDIAIEIATRIFAPVEPMSVELEIDPESDEQKLLLNVVSQGSMEAALERYRAFLDEWTEAVTPDVMLQITLMYDIRDNE